MFAFTSVFAQCEWALNWHKAPHLHDPLQNAFDAEKNDDINVMIFCLETTVNGVIRNSRMAAEALVSD